MTIDEAKSAKSSQILLEVKIIKLKPKICDNIKDYLFGLLIQLHLLATIVFNSCNIMTCHKEPKYLLLRLPHDTKD